jgi:hypothetical protein
LIATGSLRATLFLSLVTSNSSVRSFRLSCPSPLNLLKTHRQHRVKITWVHKILKIFCSVCNTKKFENPWVFGILIWKRFCAIILLWKYLCYWNINMEVVMWCTVLEYWYGSGSVLVVLYWNHLIDRIRAKQKRSRNLNFGR